MIVVIPVYLFRDTYLSTNNGSRRFCIVKCDIFIEHFHELHVISLKLLVLQIAWNKSIRRHIYETYFLTNKRFINSWLIKYNVLLRK